jgi:hypothetical protein
MCALCLRAVTGPSLTTVVGSARRRLLRTPDTGTSSEMSARAILLDLHTWPLRGLAVKWLPSRGREYQNSEKRFHGRSIRTGKVRRDAPYALTPV